MSQFQSNIQDSLFSSLNLDIKITVPDDYDHDHHLKLFEYANINRLIDFHRFARRDIKATHKLKAGESYIAKFWEVSDGSIVSKSRALEFLLANQVVLAGFRGVTLLYKQYPSAFPISKQIVSFDRDDCYPECYRGLELAITLHLNSFLTVWTADINMLNFGNQQLCRPLWNDHCRLMGLVPC